MQHTVVHHGGFQPAWMTLGSMTGSLPSSIRPPSGLPSLRCSMHCAAAASGEASSFIVDIPRSIHAGQACSRRRLSVRVWRLWFGRAMDVGWPMAVWKVWRGVTMPGSRERQ